MISDSRIRNIVSKSPKYRFPSYINFENCFWSIKNSSDVLSKLKCRRFCVTSLSTYDFSTLYTTLPNNLIKEKIHDLIEWTFKRALKTMVHFIWPLTSSGQSRYTLWSCQNVCGALSYLLDNIYIRFGTKLYRQIVLHQVCYND